MCDSKVDAVADSMSSSQLVEEVVDIVSDTRVAVYVRRLVANGRLSRKGEFG